MIKCSVKYRLLCGGYFVVACFVMAISFSAVICSVAYAEPYSGVPKVDESTKVGLENPRSIVFDGNGAHHDMLGYYVEAGTEIIIPECTLELSSMQFVGWLVRGASDELLMVQPGDKITIAHHTTLCAMWEYEEHPSSPVLTILSNMGASCYLYDDLQEYMLPIVVTPGTELVLQVASITDLEIVAIYADSIDISQGSDFEWLYYNYHSWEDNEGLRFAMPDRDVTITIVYNYYSRTYTFDANGGTGTQETLQGRVSSMFLLPECTFIPPAGKVFVGWKNSYGEIRQPGQEPTSIPSADWYGERIFTAVWEDAPEHVHSLEAVERVGPTCTATGTEAYWKCAECEKLFSDKDGSNEISEPVEIPAMHSWGEWQLIKKATSTSEGEKTRTCTICGETEIEIIPVADENGDGTYALANTTEPTWAQGEGSDLTFVIKRDTDDDTTHAHFLSATVDGKVLPPLGYTAEEGSLRLTLLSAYLETLAVGEHTLHLIFDDGELDVSFVIVAAGSAQSGGLPWWEWALIVLGVVAAAGAAGYGIYRFRAKRQAKALRRAARKGRHGI